MTQRPSSFASLVAFSAAISLPGRAHAGGDDPAQAFESFKGEHGASWRAVFDGRTGRVEFLHGDALDLGARPRTDAEWFSHARSILAETGELHGVELETLSDDRALFLPLGQVGSSDKWTVRFRQIVAGVPVEGGFVNVLFDARGRMLSIQTHALPQLGAFDVLPGASPEQALRRAAQAFRADTGLAPTGLTTPALVVAQVERSGLRVGVLAWRVEAHWERADSEPEGFVYFLDARGGDVALRENAIHHADISGVVRTRATPGVAPDTAANPATLQNLAHTTVTAGPVSTVTDANGAFTLVGVDPPTLVTVGYGGNFNEVNNDAGPPHVLDFNVTVSSGAVLTLNPLPTEHVTSQANVALGVNAMRDWIRSVNPFDATADYLHRAFVNVNASCNAYFNGGSITFFIQAGGCVNTAYSTVVGHEDGHWLNVRYGTGNGGDGMGEGNADVFAMFLFDDPIVGRDFAGPGAHIRSGFNTRQFCGDSNPNCHGGVHASGEVWMGAAWKIRRNLNVALGNSAGDATADALFLGWMNAYNQTQIRSVIEAQWLTLDDDDGFLSNGTPNFGSIDGGFREQGFPGIDLPPVVITGVSALPDLAASAGPYAVDAVAQATAGALGGVLLYYGTHATGFASVPMTLVGGSTYRGEIPDQGGSARVRYYVEATNTQGAVARYPDGGAIEPLYFNVGPTMTVFNDTFEFELGWSVESTNLAGGEWTRADPVGTTVFNSQAQPEQGHADGAGARCRFTQQGVLYGLPDAADVDGGPTRLISPLLNLDGRVAELRYAWWLYSSANDDELVVELSDNGGATWSLVRTHSLSGSSWRESRLDINAVFAPSSQVRVRFSVSDPGDNSVTEAAVDDVRIVVLGGAGAAAPQVFCDTKINSQLCEPAIGFSGAPSASSPLPFVIGANELLNQRTGLLFYGYGAHSAPLKGGTLCCRPPVLRTAVQSTGGAAGPANCSGSLLYDMNARIRSGSDPSLAPGATVAAQFYYRDPQDAFGVGLTDAVLFQVAP